MTGSAERSCDVCVIGAGLAGSLAAIGLRRLGLNVVLIDARAVPPPEFRAEKMAVAEMAAFDRLGLGQAVRRATTAFDEVWVARYGRTPVCERRREYGFAYHDLVSAVRSGGAGAPETGKVVALEAGDGWQRVRLGDGRTIGARLVVISTGLGEAVRRMADVSVQTVSPAHSLSLGFDLLQPAASYRFGSLVAYTERRADRSAYFTLFPIGSAMRANLFVYREVGEPWTQQFRTDPTAGLHDLVPKLSRWTGPLVANGPVAIRPLSLTCVTPPSRPGLVLIGDAFMTCCPVTGVGIPKVVTDVERLLHHARGWFDSVVVPEAAIASFYNDPVKRARDRRSMAASLYARSISTAESPVWVARRLRNAAVRQVTISLRQIAASARGGRREVLA